MLQIQRGNYLAVSDAPAGQGLTRVADRECDRATRTVLLAIAAVSLGYALWAEGDKALPWLTLALMTTLASLVVPPVWWLERWGDRPAIAVLGVGFAFQAAQLLTTPPEWYLQFREPASFAAFSGWLAFVLAGAAVLVGAGLSPQPWLGRARVPLLLVPHFLLGLWLIRHALWGHTDVQYFQGDGSAALLRGVNPYTITFPDILSGWGLPYYGPGLSDGERLLFGFPYPPLSLLLALPGHLFGDYRYAQVVAVTLAGALMAYMRPGRLAPAAAALFLFTPKVFHVLEEGWTEPFVVLLLAATVYCACRYPKLLPVALGLFLAIKQYLFFVPLLAVLLLPRPLRWADLWRLLWPAAVVALVVSLPLALWNVRAFVYDVVLLQFRQPFRFDAVSYLGWYARYYGLQLPSWLTFAAVAPPLGLALWRGARTPSGFAAGVAAVYLTFFVFSKQAFANYYFFVIGALCCALAATWPSGIDGATPVTICQETSPAEHGAPLLARPAARPEDG